MITGKFSLITHLRDSVIMKKDQPAFHIEI